MKKLAIMLTVLISATQAYADDSECAAPGACRAECDKGNTSACTWLGAYYAREKLQANLVPHARIAEQLLGDACTKGSGEACDELASALSRWASLSGATADDKRVVALFKQACSLGVAHDCTDDRQALALNEKACTAGVPRACVAAAGEYAPVAASVASSGPMLAAGIGQPHKPVVKRDDAKGAALRDRAAKLVAAACAANKARTCADDPRTEAGLRAACRAGASEPCGELATKELNANKPWLDDATRACELGELGNCYAIASAYELGENALKKNPAESLRFYHKACDAHDGGSCVHLAKAERDAAKALTLFRRACDDNDLYGCEQAGDALVKTDAHQAITLFSKACELQTKDTAMYRSICGDLAKRFELGDGVSKDVARAKDLRKQGCTRGEKSSC